MQYALLIYGNESANAGMGEGDRATQLANYGAFTQSIVATGNMRGGNALLPTSMATTVRVRGGQILTTDGPFAETKEQLGGFYLVEAAHLDEAIAIAARIPGAVSGSIEVRPVQVLPPEYYPAG